MRVAPKTVAIVQSSYIPWKGYFDLINRVDEFILFDDRQYTRRDWRNRNRIKTPQGARWLTIPVQVKGRYLQRIDETLVSDPGWADQHWSTLTASYRRTPFFEEYREVFEGIFRGGLPECLSEINRILIDAVCSLLGVETRITWSTSYPAEGTKTERLVSLCLAAGATGYVSGPAARAYIEPELFERHGIELTYMDYDGYPEYEQPYPPFDHKVSILDLLFCTGPDAPRYMKTFAGVAADVI